MIPFALLLLAAASKVELVDADYQIAPADWQWVPINLKQRPATLSAGFQVRSGSGAARLLLMRREDLDDMPHGSLAQTTEGVAGALSLYLSELGEYGLVVENLDRHTPADVHLNIWLDFAQPRTPVGTLSPRRQMSVIVISLAVFFGVVTWSARRLLRAMNGPS